jgi:hypothetical protein
MKTEANYREILLFANTNFSKQEFCTKEKENNINRNNPPLEELEKACWAGLLWEILPELMDDSSFKKQFIWRITNGLHFLKINMGTYAWEVERETTLDPYYFLLAMNEN